MGGKTHIPLGGQGWEPSGSLGTEGAAPSWDSPLRSVGQSWQAATADGGDQHGGIMGWGGYSR